MGHDTGCWRQGRIQAGQLSRTYHLVTPVLKPSTLWGRVWLLPLPISRASLTWAALCVTPGQPWEGQAAQVLPRAQSKAKGCPRPTVMAGTHLLYPTVVQRENPRLICTDGKEEAQRGEGLCFGGCRERGQSIAQRAKAASGATDQDPEKGVGGRRPPFSRGLGFYNTHMAWCQWEGP